MKLTTKRYSATLGIQTVLFIVDFCINIISPMFFQNNGIALILFMIQVASLVISLAILLMTFFSTYAFQAGLIDLLYEKFHLSLIIFLLYFVLTIFVQVGSIVTHWNHEEKVSLSSTFLVTLFIIQRTVTPIYYYFYKRTTLRISDPKLFDDVWNENHETIK